MITHASLQLAQAAAKTGSFAWDPTVRGVLFPFIMFMILCGSSYLIMSTNMGNRLGFLVAAGAFFGWMTIMAGVWMIYNIGLQGTAPSWKPNEVLIGDNLLVAQDQTAAKIPLGEFHTPETAPKPGGGWSFVPEGGQARGDSQSALDVRLAPKEGNKFYADPADYTVLATYEKGAPDLKPSAWISWLGGPKRIVQDIGILQDDYRLLTQVQAVKHQAVIENGECVRKPVKREDGRLQLAQFEEKFVVPGPSDILSTTTCRMENVLVDGKPVPEQIHSVLLHKDGGARRRPGFQVFLSSLILFGIIAGTLHNRDKAVMAAMKGGALVPARS